MSTFETNATTTTIPFHYNISHKRRAKTPSFSSILLDAIYRSIDDNSDTDSSKTVSTSSTATPTINNNINIYENVPTSKQRRTKMRSDSHLETIELRHAIMIDSWIDKQQSPPPTQRQSQQHTYYNHNTDHYNSKIRLVRQKSMTRKINNTGVTLSSSSSSSSSCFTQPKICTNISSKRETSPRIFNKTKLKALKIYNDLKKNKQHNQIQQPISPGARFTAFLNSIFRNASNSPAIKSPENTPGSACSSLSSCLSKTTTTSTTTSTTLEKSKRSVRFYPVSVILDEKHYTSGHVSSCRVNNSRHDNNDHIADDQKLSSSDHQQQRKWKRNEEIDELITMNKRNRDRNRNKSNDYSKEILKIEIDEESDEDIMMNDYEDDGESCASSDLFELENLSSIGVSRFNQELPVYATTSWKKLTS